LGLVEQILNARTGELADDPKLVEVTNAPSHQNITRVSPAALERYIGEWSLPPASLNLPAWSTFSVSAGDGYLSATSPIIGTFQLYVQPDGSLFESDSQRHYYFFESEGQIPGGIANGSDIKEAILNALATTDADSPERLLRSHKAQRIPKFSPLEPSSNS
jgi:hypothetical protein